MLTTHPPATTPELDGLLDDELEFSPSFLRMYSNHLAMALVALHHLGAPGDVLQATFDRHAGAVTSGAAGGAGPRTTTTWGRS